MFSLFWSMAFCSLGSIDTVVLRKPATFVYTEEEGTRFTRHFITKVPAY